VNSQAQALARAAWGNHLLLTPYARDARTLAQRARSDEVRDRGVVVPHGPQMILHGPAHDAFVRSAGIGVVDGDVRDPAVLPPLHLPAPAPGTPRPSGNPHS